MLSDRNLLEIKPDWSLSVISGKVSFHYHWELYGVLGSNSKKPGRDNGWPAQKDHNCFLSCLHNGELSSPLTSGQQKLYTSSARDWKQTKKTSLSPSLIVSKYSTWSSSSYEGDALARFFQFLGCIHMDECTYCKLLWIKVSAK